MIGSTSFLNSQRAWLLLRRFNPQWQKRFERSESERPNISSALTYQKLRLCCTRSRESSSLPPAPLFDSCRSRYAPSLLSAPPAKYVGAANNCNQETLPIDSARRDRSKNRKPRNPPRS